MPLITLNGSNTVSEERFARLTCSSQSTTTPRNPDWPLRYMYKVNNTEITAASDTHLRYMVKTKELMIAGITKADGNMNITCTVWEENDENGTTNNLSSSFVLKVSDKLKCKLKISSIHSS